MIEKNGPSFEDLAVCDIAAKVELGDRVAVDCRIKELSPSVVRMQISAAVDLPDAFDLLIPVVQGVDQRCRVRLAWRTADMVGGAFLTPLGA